MLAQIKDDPDNPDDEKPPSNDNEDSPDTEAEEEEKKKLDDDSALNDKIHLLTDSALGGLNAKKEWIVEKLEVYSNQKYIEFKAIVEKCYDETDAAKDNAAEKLSVAYDKACVDLK